MSITQREAPNWFKPGVLMASRKEDTGTGSAGSDRNGPSTQFARDSDEYLGASALDVGRQIGADEYELFVSCNPAPAIQQQFEHLRPEFIAVHDIGTTSSRKLLNSLAAAGGRKPQRLVIRRQGHGTALATVHFVELPSAAGTKLRMYSTDCETDTSWRQSVAHMLLAFSRLGVIMVGDLRASEIAAVLGRLRDSMARGPWHNDQLLLLPLGSAGSLVNHGMELARGTNVNVRTTPQVARATDAWGFISGTWNRLTDKGPGHGATVAALAKLVTSGAPAGAAAERPTPAEAPADPTPTATQSSATAANGNGPSASASAVTAADTQTHAEPVGPGPSAAADRAAAAGTAAAANLSSTAEPLRRYVRQISEVAGVVGCAVFDASGNRMAYAGSGPSAVNLAARGAELMTAIVKAAGALELGRAMPEAAITLEANHLLLRPVPRHPGLALHIVLDRAKANLTLVRLQVLRLDSFFDEPH